MLMLDVLQFPKAPRQNNSRTTRRAARTVGAMNQQTIDQIACVACIISVALIAWFREYRWRKAVSQYIWNLHTSSNDHIKASLDPNMTEGLRTFNHARALERSRIAKELDLLVLDGAVAHEMWILQSKEAKKVGENGSENEETG